MATPTSSSNRSKRKGTKPITQGQNPQRGNRQKVSNAQVTNSSTRGSNTGSAKVTTGRGANAPKPADPWKAPTTKNSRTSAPKGNTTFRTNNTGITMPNSRRAGVNLPKVGAQVERSANQGPTLRGTTSGTRNNSKPAPKAPAKPSAKPSIRGAVRTGVGVAGATALLAPLVAEGVKRTTSQDFWNQKSNELRDRQAAGAPAFRGTRTGTASGRTGRGGTTADRPSTTRSNSSVATDGRYVPGSQQVRPPAPKPTAKPPASPSASRPSQSTPSRSTASGGGGGSQRSAAPQAAKPAMPGRKWEDFNPGRGTSRTNNPLIDDTMKARMRQREEQQATTSGSSKSDDKSKYVASNGQQYAGPAFGNDSNKSDSSAIAQKSGSEKLKDAIDKQREKRKQQQQQILARRTGS